MNLAISSLLIRVNNKIHMKGRDESKKGMFKLEILLKIKDLNYLWTIITYMTYMTQNGPVFVKNELQLFCLEGTYANPISKADTF